MQTVFGAFDDRAQAQRAVEQLVQDGFDRADIHIEQQESTQTLADDQQAAGDRHGGIVGFFEDLFGSGDSTRERASTYSEAVRRGSCVVIVDAQDDAQAERAAICLDNAGAIDVDERAQQWRSEGWGSDLPAQQNKEGVMDVVQEDLKVGKRSFDKGGVRVVQRVSEKPVREVVRLREERAIVERRPVDRPVEAGALDSMKEGTLEVRETAEEPVVAKTARVVEEVRVGKQVQEREEVIEDKVRRKDVDVERMSGQRERAVASDSDQRAAAKRERDIADQSPKKKPL